MKEQEQTIEKKSTREVIQEFNSNLGQGGYLTLAGHQSFDEDTFNALAELMSNFIGKHVIVDIRANLFIEQVEDSNYENCMRILGELEFNQSLNQYRVLINEHIYAYFKPENIFEVATHGDEVSDDNFSNYANGLIGIRF